MESVIVCNNILLSLSTKYLSPRTLRNFCTYYFLLRNFYPNKKFCAIYINALISLIKKMLNVIVIECSNYADHQFTI